MNPNWDDYFLKICNAVGSNSTCLSQQIGAILVRDKVVICTGYNGPPRGYPPCEAVDTVEGTKICKRRAVFPSGMGLHMCPAAHAERNAIIQAARLGIKVKGSTLYLNTNIPCKDCLIEIINAGIIEVVCIKLTHYDQLSKKLIKRSDLEVREFNL